MEAPRRAEPLPGVVRRRDASGGDRAIPASGPVVQGGLVPLPWKATPRPRRLPERSRRMSNLRAGDGPTPENSDRDDENLPSGAAATGWRRPRLRAFLTWFGIDPRGDILPVDRRHCCHHAGCDRPVLVGEEACPVHLGLASPAELVQAPPRIPPGTIRALAMAVLAGTLGLGLALLLRDPGFGWLGVASAASVLGSLVARRSNLPLVASLLGTAGFFGWAILVCAGLLAGALALLPALL